MSSLDNIIPSQVTKAERWTKLYRSIHSLFLKDEFVHIDDYKQMVTEMNARIAMVEANANASITAAVAALQAAIIGHFHVAPQAPAGALPTGLGTITVPPVVTPPVPTKQVTPVTIAMEARNAQLLGLGPATAPLAGGVAQDELLANTTIKTDIGV